MPTDTFSRRGATALRRPRSLIATFAVLSLVIVLVLYLALYRIVARASRTIRVQGAKPPARQRGRADGPREP